MSMTITHTGPTSAHIAIAVCRIGDFLTAGRTHLIGFDIVDSVNLREMSAYINRLKTESFNGTVSAGFNGKNMTMDSSIWTELADALLAFTLSVDFNNLTA